MTDTAHFSNHLRTNTKPTIHTVYSEDPTPATVDRSGTGIAVKDLHIVHHTSQTVDAKLTEKALIAAVQAAADLNAVGLCGKASKDAHTLSYKAETQAPIIVEYREIGPDDVIDKTPPELKDDANLAIRFIKQTHADGTATLHTSYTGKHLHFNHDSLSTLVQGITQKAQGKVVDLKMSADIAAIVPRDPSVPAPKADAGITVRGLGNIIYFWLWGGLARQTRPLAITLPIDSLKATIAALECAETEESASDTKPFLSKDALVTAIQAYMQLEASGIDLLKIQKTMHLEDADSAKVLGNPTYFAFAEIQKADLTGHPAHDLRQIALVIQRTMTHFDRDAAVTALQSLFNASNLAMLTEQCRQANETRAGSVFNTTLHNPGAKEGVTAAREIGLSGALPFPVPGPGVSHTAKTDTDTLTLQLPTPVGQVPGALNALGQIHHAVPSLNYVVSDQWLNHIALATNGSLHATSIAAMQDDADRGALAMLAVVSASAVAVRYAAPQAVANVMPLFRNAARAVKDRATAAMP